MRNKVCTRGSAAAPFAVLRAACVTEGGPQGLRPPQLPPAGELRARSAFQYIPAHSSTFPGQHAGSLRPHPSAWHEVTAREGRTADGLPSPMRRKQRALSCLRKQNQTQSQRTRQHVCGRICIAQAHKGHSGDSRELRRSQRVQQYQCRGRGIVSGASYHVGLVVYLWVCRKQKQTRLSPGSRGRPAARLPRQTRKWRATEGARERRGETPEWDEATHVGAVSVMGDGPALSPRQTELPRQSPLGVRVTRTRTSLYAAARRPHTPSSSGGHRPFV